MSITKITEDNVIELLEKVVERNGADYIDPLSDDPYDDCEYIYDHEGTTRRCIIGELASVCGMSDTKIGAAGEINPSAIEFLLHEEIGLLDENPSGSMVDLLGSAQGMSDEGCTWGKILEWVKARDSADYMEV